MPNLAVWLGARQPAEACLDIVICLIVVASFAVFAVDQTNNASDHQQQDRSIGHRRTASAPTAAQSGRRPAERTRARSTKRIDEASNELTSPFAGVVSGSSSEWAVRGVKLLLALLVYGFGLGYLARVLRVRV